MLSKKVENILNKQIEKEGYSSNLYLAMASWAENEGYKGISDWLYAQTEEERMHMLKFISYINEKDGKAIIPAFEKPVFKVKTVKELFDAVLKHEKFITASINDIVELVLQEKDFSTYSWVQWFVTEQIEEEANVRAILDKLKLVGEANLYLFDRDIMTLRTPAAGEGA
ncbi:MAG: ferritin [Bacteroidales bacterium]|nr:ferritin [Bacteroidales bacterium]